MTTDFDFFAYEPRWLDDGRFQSRLDVAAVELAIQEFGNSPTPTDIADEKNWILGEYQNIRALGLSLPEADVNRWRNAIHANDPKCLYAEFGLPDDRALFRKLAAERLNPDKWFASLSETEKSTVMRQWKDGFKR